MVLFEDQPISIFPNNRTTIKGIFYFLQKLNGEYGTRYSIKGFPTSDSSSSIETIDKLGHSLRYWSKNNEFNLTFSFDSPFFVTDYSLMNAAPVASNSYPSAWKLFGKDKRGNLHLIDKRENQNFADGKSEVSKTFSTRARTPFSEYVWLQTKSSVDYKWVNLKHFDFFGILCGKTGDCKIPFNCRTCKIKTDSLFSLRYFFVILLSS